MKRQVPLITDCQGSAAIITVVLMFIFIGLLAFIIDLAHVKTVKTELQNTADASALAGARAFLRYDLPTTGPQGSASVEEDPDPVTARTEAYKSIAENRSDNISFQVGDLALEDIQVGIWDFKGDVSGTGKPTWMAWEWPPPASMWGKYIGPAVRLPAHRNDQVSLGAVGSDKNPALSHARMLMARLFGFSSIPVQAWATAALSAVGGFTEEGCPDFPLCINEAELLLQGNQIIFHPDGEDSGGWTNLRPTSEGDRTDANDIKTYFRNCGGCGNLDPNGDRTVYLNNGTMCSATRVLIEERGLCFQPPLSLVNVDPTYTDPPNKGNTWVPARFAPPFSTTDPDTRFGDPVYTFAVCTKNKFNQWETIGATCYRVLQVSSSPDDCTLMLQKPEECDKTLGGTYGRGKWYGVLSPEPKLVQ